MFFTIFLTLVSVQPDVNLFQAIFFHKEFHLIDNTRFNDLLNQIKLEYFHGEMYAYGKEIRPTREIPLADPEFLYMPTNNANKEFADNGAFVRGCIKISKIEDN